MLLLLGYSLGLIESKNKALPPTPYYQSKPPVFCSMKHEPRSKIYYANIMIRRFEPRYSRFRSSQPVRRSPFVLRYSFYFSSFRTSASCNTFRIAGLESCCHSYCSLIESCHWWVLPPIAHVHELIPLILLTHLKIRMDTRSSFWCSLNPIKVPKEMMKMMKQGSLQILVELLENKMRSKLLKLLAKRCSLKQRGLAVWANGA